MIRAVIEVALLAMIGVSVSAPFLGDVWVTSLASNFVLQFIVVGLVMGAIGWAASSAGMARLGLILAFVNAIVLAADLGTLRLAPGAARASASAPTLRIMTQNVLFAQHDLDALLETIDEVHPDVLMLQEIGTVWATSLPKIASRFTAFTPIGTLSAANEGHGTVLFSAHPILANETLTLGGVPARASVATLSVGDVPVSVASFHAVKPSTPRSAAVQSRQISELADWVNGQEGTVIVAGDFNATLHSPLLRRFAGSTNMTNDLRAHAAQTVLVGTFPASLPAFGLKIDHVFLRQASFERAKTVRVAGPDHRGVVTDVALYPN